MNNSHIRQCLFDVFELCSQEKNLLVFVEASVVTDHYLTDDENFQLVQDKLMRFREG